MREIRTNIEIDAPIEIVWDVLLNFDGWSKWNPSVNQASGIASVGSVLTITMRAEGGEDGQKYMPVVTFIDEPKKFEWRTKMVSESLFSNGRVFELESTSKGTHLVNKETFGGDSCTSLLEQTEQLCTINAR